MWVSPRLSDTTMTHIYALSSNGAALWRSIQMSASDDRLITTIVRAGCCTRQQLIAALRGRDADTDINRVRDGWLTDMLSKGILKLVRDTDYTLYALSGSGLEALCWMPATKAHGRIMRHLAKTPMCSASGLIDACGMDVEKIRDGSFTQNNEYYIVTKLTAPPVGRAYRLGDRGREFRGTPTKSDLINRIVAAVGDGQCTAVELLKRAKSENEHIGWLEKFAALRILAIVD